MIYRISYRICCTVTDLNVEIEDFTTHVEKAAEFWSVSRRVLTGIASALITLAEQVRALRTHMRDAF